MKKVLALIVMALLLSGCTNPQSTTPANTTAAPTNTTVTTSATTTPVPSPKLTTTSYTLAQVTRHNSMKDCWMVIDGSVYDATTYLPNHGDMQIVDGCGKDATVMFNQERKHSKSETLGILPNLKIGTLTK